MTTQEAFRYIIENDVHANQYRLAKALEVSHTSIKNYLDGKTSIRLDIYKRFQTIYPEVIIDDVYGEEYKLGLKTIKNKKEE